MKIPDRWNQKLNKLLHRFKKTENAQDIRQSLCLIVYVKFSQGCELFLEELRGFGPFAEMDLVEGKLFFYCASEDLNAQLELSVGDAQSKFACAYSMGMLTLVFNPEGELQSPPIGLAINDAILKASRLSFAQE